MSHSGKVNRSGKDESYMKRWFIHEKVNHTSKGESYMKRWIVSKRWIIHEKVNHAWKGESYMKRWKINEKLMIEEKVNNKWKVNHSVKVNHWCKGESYMIHLFMNDSPFHEWFTFWKDDSYFSCMIHTFEKVIHLFMYESFSCMIHLFSLFHLLLSLWHIPEWIHILENDSPFHVWFTSSYMIHLSIYY